MVGAIRSGPFKLVNFDTELQKDFELNKVEEHRGETRDVDNPDVVCRMKARFYVSGAPEKFGRVPEHSKIWLPRWSRPTSRRRWMAGTLWTPPATGRRTSVTATATLSASERI